MYPLCKDCIHRRVEWFTKQCKKTNVGTDQSRKNSNLCGEHADFFSPSFLSMGQLAKYPPRFFLENEVVHDTGTNRTTPHCSCKGSNRRL